MPLCEEESVAVFSSVYPSSATKLRNAVDSARDPSPSVRMRRCVAVGLPCVVRNVRMRVGGTDLDFIGNGHPYRVLLSMMSK